MKRIKSALRSCLSPVKNYLFSRSVYLINSLINSKKVNIGSGKRAWVGWTLLDEITDLNIQRAKFSEKTILDFRSNSQNMIYSSHFFEHINRNVTEKLLEEAFRVLTSGGFLIIKIPNYDSVLDSFFRGDYEVINNFSFGNLPKSWPLHGTEDNIESRVSMIFAGYYTRSYGEHFTDPESVDEELGYHGPAKISKNELLEILNTKNPAFISDRLVEEIFRRRQACR